MKYNKTNWKDRLVQFPNRFKDQANTQWTLTPDPGTITEAGTPLSKLNHDNIEDGLDKAHNQYPDTEVQITKPLQVVTATQNSRMKLQKVVGRTLVNLLGRDGNCESLSPFTVSGTVALSTTQKRSGNNSIKITATASAPTAIKDYSYTLDATKQYIFACWVYIESYTDGSIALRIRDYGGSTTRYTANADSAKIGQWQLIYVKIPVASTLVGNGFRLITGTSTTGTHVAYFDDIRLYEVTAAEYTAIGSTITGEAIDAYLPYMDDIKPVAAPYFRKYGKNIFSPFAQTTFTGDAAGTYSISSPYTATINKTLAITACAFVNDKVSVVSGQTIKLTANVTITNYGGSNGAYLEVHNAANNTWLHNSAIRTSSGVTQASYVIPAGVTEIIVRCTVNGLATGNYTFSNPMVEFGATYSDFEPRNDDYSFFPNTFLHASPDGSVADILYEDGDGQARKLAAFKEMLIDGNLFVSFAQDYTGFKRFSIPINSGIATAYTQQNDSRFRIVKYNGNIISNVSSFTGSDQAWIDLDSNGGLKITIADIDSGWGESYTPSAAEIKAYFYGWKMYDGLSFPNGDGTYTRTDGLHKCWAKRAKNGTYFGGTTILPTSSYPEFYVDWTPYRLIYQLAKPVPESVEREGTITLHEGGNLVEVGCGVVVKEVANPAYYATSNRYYINDTNIGGKLLTRSKSMIGVFRNSSQDYKWTLATGGGSYGLQEYHIAASDYDKSSLYAVTYLALDTYLIGTAPQTVTIAAPYNLRPSLDSVAAASAEQDKRIDALENAKYSPPPNTLASVNTGSKDATIGVYRDIDYTRLNGTLAMTSRLTNPDTNGFYRTLTWVYYDDTGKMATRTVVWSIVYDSDGLIMSRTPSAV